MAVECQRSTSGGKGNIGRFIERDRKICGAGIPTAQPDGKVADFLQHYLLKDEADALSSDALAPPKPPRPLPPLRHPVNVDKRNAGFFTDVAQLINPASKTKCQTLAQDLRETVYASYWKQALGQVKDPIPMLPEGIDLRTTTFGKKTEFHGRLYDIIMPKDPLPDKTPAAQRLAAQKDRNYSQPPYNPNITYGVRTSGIDKGGVRCCITNDRVKQGTSGRDVITSALADYRLTSVPKLGESLSRYDVPKHQNLRKPDTDGGVPECLAYCKVHPEKEHIIRCFSHLNMLRIVLSTRYLPTFFANFYLQLKYFDKEQTGWLPRDVVYEYCATKFIRFDPSLIEPLLVLWKAFDGDQIEYKTFVRVINYRTPSIELPKLPDYPDACMDFRTTYIEMLKPKQPMDCVPMAGVPSGRYLDVDYPISPEDCIKADRTCLPDESDAKSCLNPSVMTLLHVNHRDMYQKRDPELVRQVFEKAGEVFTDDSFKEIWEEAKKYHSQGWVCFETFRRALRAIRPSED